MYRRNIFDYSSLYPEDISLGRLTSIFREERINSLLLNNKKMLSLEIIEKYNLKKEGFRPDHDDFGYKFEFPNGIELSGLYICNGFPCELDCLEGLDGYIYIETEEELVELINMSLEEVFNKILIKHPDFNKNEY